MRICAILGFALQLSGATSFLSAAEKSPRDVLERQFGLKKVGSNWALPLELQLRARLDALPELKRRIVDGEMRVAALAQAQQRQWNQKPQLEQLQAELRRKIASTTGPDQKKLEEDYRQVEALLAQILAPAAMAGAPDMRAALLDLIAARNSLLATVTWVREQLPRIADDYSRLASNQELTRAIAGLGGGQKLGPIRDYNSDLRKLAELEATVTRSPLFGENTPIYLEGDRARIVALVGDETPLTFTWTSSESPAIITANAAAAVGIVPESGPLQEVRRGGRTLLGRPAVIPYLRVGARLVREVPVIVLPPEGENWGSELSATSIPGFHGRLELEQLRLRLEPSKSGSP